MKKEKATWLPPIRPDGSHGWLNINGETFNIVNIHSYDGYGSTLDTFTIQEPNGKTREVYTQDEGDTFTFDIE